MTVKKLREILEDKLANPDRNISFDREKNVLRIENIHTKKGINISLPPLLAKWEEKKDAAIEEVVYLVNEGLTAMTMDDIELNGKEKRIFPVIRSTSFPKQTKAGKTLVTDEHTAETRIYYAVDLGKTFRLIDENMLEKAGWEKEQLREVARFNVRSLPCPLKVDTVAENNFYFLNSNDGYDASRILNETLLKDMEEKVEGKLVISIPHQDVLIFADIKNDTGYDILAQMTMSYYTAGQVPITSLSFYYENGKLQPIFIMAQNKPKRKE